MKVTNAIAQILKKEGVEWLIGYPVNPIIEGAAEADIRTIMVRQERIGLHMCDAIGKLSSGDKIGVFVMQHGPGTENAFGGVAQSYGDSCPVVVLPAGYARNINQVHPNFNAALNFRNVTKLSEQVTVADATVETLRRAFTTVKNGRPGPVLVEFPTDILREEVPDALVAEYRKTPRLRSGPDPQSVSAIAEALVAATRPVIVAGQGVHYGKAWAQLKALAELLEAPVMTTLAGQERLSRKTIRCHWARAASVSASISGTSCRTPILFSASAAASRVPASVRRCRRGKRSRMRRSTPMRSTRTCRSIWRRSAMPA